MVPRVLIRSRLSLVPKVQSIQLLVKAACQAERWIRAEISNHKDSCQRNCYHHMHLLCMLKYIYISFIIIMIQEENSDCIGNLPPNVIVHDMSFDWTGRRLAAACSDRIIRVYIKKAQKWIQQGIIKIQGASAWKVKWARPEFGTIIATCSLDTQIRIYSLQKIDKGEGEKNQWISVHSIQQNKAIEDIKFIPSKSHGLSLAIVSSDGYLKVLTASDPLKLKEWGFQYSLPVNELGLSCLSWSKNLVKEQESIIVVGCKTLQNSPKKVVNGMKVYPDAQQERYQTNTSTVVFLNFSRNSIKPLQKINVPKIKQTKTINDVSWALMNGRSYYLLAIASDTFIKIFQLNIKESQKQMPAIDVLKEIPLSNQPCMRLSWNIMGTYISGSEKKRIRVWRCVSRGIWTPLENIQS